LANTFQKIAPAMLMEGTEGSLAELQALGVQELETSMSGLYDIMT